MQISRGLKNACEIENKLYSTYLSDKKIKVYISKRIVLPLTMVFYPNRIFVPEHWHEWDEQCRRLVLKHEESHLKRHDNLIQIFQNIAQALFFFHPLVYFLNKKMNLYREMICDDHVVMSEHGSRLEYSKCLTDIAEKVVWKRNLYQSVSAFSSQKSALSHRINYQMKEVIMANHTTKFYFFIITILLLSIPAFSWYLSNTKADASFVERLNNDHIEVIIYNKSDIRLDGKKISLEEFKTSLEKMAQEAEDPIIYLEYAKNVTVAMVFKVQQILRELDLLKVRYVDDDDHSLNLTLPNTLPEKQLEKIDKKNILTLNITSSGKIRTEDLTIDISDLEKFLRESHLKNEYLIVAVKADHDLVYRDFMIVMDEIRKSQSKRLLIYENVE
jgi:biopolymer transport protein ExbD